MTPELVVAPLATFVSVSLLVTSLFSPKRNEAAEKLKPYGYRAAQDPDNLNRPFADRIVFPMLERVGRVAGSTAPRQMQERFKSALEQGCEPLVRHACERGVNVLDAQGAGQRVQPIDALELCSYAVGHAIVVVRDGDLAA